VGNQLTREPGNQTPTTHHPSPITLHPSPGPMPALLPAMHTSDMSKAPLPHLRLSFFSPSLSTYKCPEIASAGPSSCRCCPAQTSASYNSTHTHTHSHTSTHDTLHLLPQEQRQRLPPAANVHSGNSGARSDSRRITSQPSCPRALVPSSTTSSPHTTPRISLQGILQRAHPTSSLLCKAATCSRNMGAPPSS
jgi:hypothetical protein